jgi:signal transduction histidine kinase
MSSRRLNEIEKMLDTMDESDTRYEALNAEADRLAEELSKIEEIYLAQLKLKEAEFEAKAERIKVLDRLGQIDQIVEEYGNEFIDDYDIDSDSISSRVTEEQWNNVDTETKLRQLLYNRICNAYIRLVH